MALGVGEEEFKVSLPQRAEAEATCENVK
jgi:hypothetical protein